MKEIILLSTIIILLDAIFLYVVSYLFIPMIISIQKEGFQLNYFAAFIAYLFIIFQVYYFIIIPKSSLLFAFLLGTTTYGIYEFTNYSVIKNWNILVASIDTLWGGILYLLTTYFFRIFT
tara:strand:- start:155 stop:514 length:360 start_codon:yes stop_codon:yes gene_type:complete